MTVETRCRYGMDEDESESESEGESENESPTQCFGWLGAIYQGGPSGRTWMGYVVDVPTGQDGVFVAQPEVDSSVEEVVGVFSSPTAARMAVLDALKRKWRESSQYLATHAAQSAFSVPTKPTRGPRAARKRRRSV